MAALSDEQEVHRHQIVRFRVLVNDSGEAQPEWGQVYLIHVNRSVTQGEGLSDALGALGSFRG